MKKHRGRHLLSLLASAALLASLLPAAFAAEAEGEKHITILGTSDMHGNIWGYSYEDNAETDNNGMARLYTYIQQVRAENPNTFLVDAGDDIQGTIMTDDLYNKTPEEPHPVVTAMNYMGYDAMTLGNHEFNWGIPTMQSILGQASFPVLAANVTGAQGEPVTGAGWTIVERGGVKLAVIGVVTPDVPIWDSGKDGIDDAVYEAANVAVGKAIDEIGDSVLGGIHSAAPTTGASSGLGLGDSMRDAIDSAGWMGQIPCLILLLIPFLVSKGATIVVTVVILLRFVQIYMLTAFNPLPIAFIAQEETRQWGINYFKQYASLVFQCATLYLAILMYRTLVGGTLNPSKFKDGDSLSGWVMDNFTGLLLASVMLIGIVMAANSVAKKLFGGE